jgi:inosine-uridine nucleoside N-ribohydrolase
MTGSGMPLILDVDTGIDDAVAIALACLSPRADLVAVTTVAGNTTIENATRNSLDVLDMLGCSHVPVYRGASRPLARSLQTAAHKQGDNGIGGAALPASRRHPGEYKGPAAIIRLALERPGELTLVCCGPLTNLAIALNVEPGLTTLLKSVVILGGAYSVPGNMSRTSEFNVYVDPEAASQVFSSPFANLTAIGLDLTASLEMSREMWENAGRSDTAVGTLLHAIYAASFEAPQVGGGYVEFHDALVVAAALEPDLIECEPRTVVVHAGFDERGTTRLVDPARTLVGVSVDQDRFMQGVRSVFAV